MAEDFFDRWDTRNDIRHITAIQNHKKRRKEFTFFMQACAIAFVEETMTKSFPPAPRFLANDIKKAGGTARWLEANPVCVDLLTV